MGGFQHGVTELACRLISLHLRRGTPLAEVIDQIGGIQEMQPFFNRMPDGTSVQVLGLGDGIAHVLKQYLKTGEEVKEAGSRQGRLKRHGQLDAGRHPRGRLIGGGLASHLQDTTSEGGQA